MLPLLGSNHRMRGYYEGRYRDKNAISGQLEYRHKLRAGGMALSVGRARAPWGLSLHHLDDGRGRLLRAWAIALSSPRVNVRRISSAAAKLRSVLFSGRREAF